MTDLQLPYERTDDGIVILRLDQPQRPVVVLDQWLLDQLHLFFDQLEQQQSPSGFVLASSSEKVFVAGADLAEISQLNDEQLHGYLAEGAEAYARISSLDCPTAAAINGSALGGGLEIAMHCDALFAARDPEKKPWQFGQPEAGLGLCPGWGGTQMLPARIDPATAIEHTATGKLWTIDAPPEGLFEQIVSSESELLDAALGGIRANPTPNTRHIPRCIYQAAPDTIDKSLKSIKKTLPDTPAAHAVVEAIEIGLEQGWAEGVKAERRLLVSLRHTHEAKAKLEAFFARNR